MLEDSKEHIEKAIQEKETFINRGIIDEEKGKEKQIEKQQKSRNRGIVKDIITTCRGYIGDIRDEFDQMRGEEDVEWSLYLYIEYLKVVLLYDQLLL